MINEICLWIALPKCMMIRIIVVVMMYVQKSVFVDVEPTQIECNRELFCHNSLNPNTAGQCAYLYQGLKAF